MARTKNPSGPEVKVYTYGDTKIVVLPYFLYEVCVSKYWSTGFCVLGNRFFRSEVPLNIKCHRKLKRYNGYFIEKEITLIGAPHQFIRENNLSEYKPIVKTKKFRRK